MQGAGNEVILDRSLETDPEKDNEKANMDNNLLDASPVHSVKKEITSSEFSFLPTFINQKITQAGKGLSKCAHFDGNVRIFTKMHTFSRKGECN